MRYIQTPYPDRRWQRIFRWLKGKLATQVSSKVATNNL